MLSNTIILKYVCVYICECSYGCESVYFFNNINIVGDYTYFSDLSHFTNFRYNPYLFLWHVFQSRILRAHKIRLCRKYIEDNRTFCVSINSVSNSILSKVKKDFYSKFSQLKLICQTILPRQKKVAKIEN